MHKTPVIQFKVLKNEQKALCWLFAIWSLSSMVLNFFLLLVCFYFIISFIYRQLAFPSACLSFFPTLSPSPSLSLSLPSSSLLLSLTSSLSFNLTPLIHHNSLTFSLSSLISLSLLCPLPIWLCLFLLSLPLISHYLTLSSFLSLIPTQVLSPSLPLPLILFSFISASISISLTLTLVLPFLCKPLSSLWPHLLSFSP